MNKKIVCKENRQKLNNKNSWNKCFPKLYLYKKLKAMFFHMKKT